VIHSIQDFVDCFSGIRKPTRNYVRGVPADRLDWSPKAGEFTCAGILRHIGSGEKMFVGVTRGSSSQPTGDGFDADGDHAAS
jgi:hypothetical protein